MLIRLFRAEQVNNAPAVLKVDAKDIILKAIDYIHEHYSEQLLLPDVAKRFNYSMQYFNKFFQRQTGMSFKQYLQMVRIQAAAELLRTTDLSVEVICGRVGYYDLKHFYLTFRKHIGIAPMKYRSYIRKQTKLFSAD